MSSPKIKISFVSFSFIKGGASIAARKFSDISKYFENVELNAIINQDKAGRIQFIKRLISYVLIKMQYDGNPIKHSLNLFSFPPAVNAFKKNGGDIYHLHWVNNDTLSIFDLDKIPSGSIITLHDEWLYCGAEHYYSVDDESFDFIQGYQILKKGVYGIHWNYLIWKIKFNKLKSRSDLIFTVPSKWMLLRASSSLMLKKTKLRYLPNPIDIVLFSPFPTAECLQFRRDLDFTEHDFIISFGAIGGGSILKGSNLLEEALALLAEELPSKITNKVKLVDFGGDKKGKNCSHGLDHFSIGHISSPSELALLYASVDCVVVPSLVESFGQVAAEALSCETPVICFDYSGLIDIVLNEVNGLTAIPYSVRDLADKLKLIILMSSEKRKKFGAEGRKHIIDNFSYPVISNLYKKIIDESISLKADLLG